MGAGHSSHSSLCLPETGKSDHPLCPALPSGAQHPTHTPGHREVRPKAQNYYLTHLPRPSLAWQCQTRTFRPACISVWVRPAQGEPGSLLPLARPSELGVLRNMAGHPSCSPVCALVPPHTKAPSYTQPGVPMPLPHKESSGMLHPPWC